MQFFDPKQDVSIIERRLPHWSQAGTVAFLTWRTWDSIPQRVLVEWLAERQAWLVQHGIDPESADWQARLQQLPLHEVREFQETISERWNEHLDACHGECVLRRPELARVVSESLAHFDGVRYDLTDFVVMPNHVHVLAAFPDEDSMLAQCESWKHFTAHELNRALHRSGRLWQQDGFDHLVRSLEQFEHLQCYIAQNPIKARLSPGAYIHFSKPQSTPHAPP